MTFSGRRSYVVIAAFATFYLYPFLRVLWRVGDEGTLVYGAARIAEGAIPYRDFFEVMGPASFYWLGSFFALFGTTWLTSRIFLLGTAVCTVLLIHHLDKRIRPGSDPLPAILFLAISFPLWPAVNHHWDSNLFALASFTLFAAWLNTRRMPRLVGTGVLAGLTTCFMQQKGALLLLSYLVVIWIIARAERIVLKSAAVVGAAYAAVGAVVVSFYYLAGALPQLIYANLIWPLSSYHRVNVVPYAYGLKELYWQGMHNAFTSWFGASAGVPISGFVILPLAAVAAVPLAALGFALWNRSAFDRRALPYWICGAALWISEIHRRDITHLVYGSPLLLIACFYGWGQKQNTAVRTGRRVLATATALFLAFNLLVAFGAQTRTQTRRGVVYTTSQDSALQFLTSHVPAGEPAFVYPYYPMYYFLADVKNPTPFSILMYHINTESQFRDAVNRLEQAQVRHVLWDSVVSGKNLSTWFPGYQHPAESDLIMEQYLLAHYKEVGLANGFRLLQRIEGPTSPGGSDVALQHSLGNRGR